MSMDAVMRQSQFSRDLGNAARMGAFYTDPEHCKRIGQLFAFPDEEVCVLEPSIGNGVAVNNILQGCKSPTVFGVELNTCTYDALKEKEAFPYLLNADFLNGVKISRGAFSFCFANPPYGMHQESKERLEKLFVEKLWGYLKTGAIFALVIPYYVLAEEKFARCFLARFNPLAFYRFDDDVYASYQQVVIIGQRRASLGMMRTWLPKFMERISSVDKFEYLPQMGEEVQKIPVSASNANDIEYFTTLAFDVKKAAASLKNSELYRFIEKKAMVPEYHAAKLSRPPVPLKKDSLYLCAISGYGQGLAGSEETHDLHLQRGSAKVIATPEIVSKDGKSVVVEHNYTKMVLNIIENNGKITTLE